jgi:hypothetical protein
MGVVNRLIRHVFGTLAAPASIQNKMIKTDIGIDGSSDRTRFIVRDNFGTYHRFITQDEVQSLIDRGIATLSGVYIISSDEAGCRGLIASASVINIWYQGPALVDNTPIDVISSKNIYGADNESFKLTANMTINYPTSGADQDIEIRFFNGIDNDQSGAFAIATGGYTGNGGFNYNLKTTTVRADRIVESTDVKISYEINIADIDPIAGTLDLWSGLNVSGKLNNETVVNQSPLSPSSNDQSRELTVTKDAASEGVELYERIVQSLFEGAFFERFREFVVGKSEWGINLGAQIGLSLFKTASNFFVFGVGTQVYPWTISAFDLGVDAWSSYTFSPRVSGTCNNAYYGGNPVAWRAKSTGRGQRIEFDGNGDIVEYTTPSSVVTDAQLFFVERKRTDSLGNIYHDGSDVISSLDSTYKYEVYLGGKIIITNKTLGDEFVMHNAVRLAASWAFLDAGYATAYVQKDGVFERRISTTEYVSGSKTLLWGTEESMGADGVLHLSANPVIDL